MVSQPSCCLYMFASLISLTSHKIEPTRMLCRPVKFNSQLSQDAELSLFPPSLSTPALVLQLFFLCQVNSHNLQQIGIDSIHSSGPDVRARAPLAAV